MPTLVCDLASVVSDVSFERVYRRLEAANGGRVALADPQQLNDDMFRAFEAGQLGESEYARHVGARLAWHGSDADLVDIFADLYGSVDVAVMELLVALRGRGWYLVGLDHHHGPATWGGQYAEQLTVFDRVVATSTGRPGPELRPTDPRFFAQVLRDVPGSHGPRLFVADHPAAVAAARRAGLDAHLFRGAAGLRSVCLELTVGV
jgi:FMN phosphatase YigB (HAD superfamily)